MNEMAAFGSRQEMLEYQRSLDENRDETHAVSQAQERGQPAVIGSPPARR
jgi:hypothetical protein